jgi:hypothetical protein
MAFTSYVPDTISQPISVLNGMFGQTWTDGSGTISFMSGLEAYSFSGGSANISASFGLYSYSEFYGSGGTIANAFGASCELLLTGATTITNLFGNRILFTKTAGTVGTAIGLDISNVNFATNNFAIRTNAGNIVFNESGDASTNFRVEGDTNTHLLFTQASNERVGINNSSPAAKLDISQSSTSAAIPVLTVSQADVSEEFIRFVGSSANGVLTQSIVENADVGTSTLQGWLKVFVQDDGNQLTDQAYYIPVYTLA